MGCGLGSTYISAAAQVKDAVITTAKISNLVGSTTLSVAGAALTISGLSLPKGKIYRVLASINAHTAQVAHVGVYFNADTTVAHYHTEGYEVDDTNIDESNSNVLANQINSVEGTLIDATLFIGASGYIEFQGFAGWTNQPGSSPYTTIFHITKLDATATSITEVSILPEAGDGNYAAGSWLKIYEVS